MGDIVGMLRELYLRTGNFIHRDAADEITRLRKEVEKAEACTRCNGGCPDKDHPVVERWCQECYDNLCVKPIEWLRTEVDAIRTRMERVADERDANAKEAHKLREALKEIKANCGCCDDAAPCANCLRIEASLAALPTPSQD